MQNTGNFFSINNYFSYLRYRQQFIVFCFYIKVLIELVLKLLISCVDDKILILTYSICAIKEIQSLLSNKNVKCLVFQGDTSSTHRKEMIEEFNDRSKLENRVLLLSFKSGGAGIFMVLLFLLT